MMDVGSSFDEKSGNLVLDASHSRDPEGRDLVATWIRDGRTERGPRFTVAAQALAERPALLRISDGLTDVAALISTEIDPQTLRPKRDPHTGKDIIILTPEHLKCTSMSLSQAGASKLNPTVTLGPVPPLSDSQQVPLDANHRPTRDFVLGFRFEVVATVESAPDKTLYEGQDIAQTVTANGSSTPKRGWQRVDPNRSIDETRPQTDAPFPQTVPTPEPHSPRSAPTIIGDDYDNHPLIGFVFKNGTSGIESIGVKKKDLVDDKTLAWIDQPGVLMDRGANLSNGYLKRAYFRTWLIPDVEKCEKFFTYTLEVDSTGAIKKNELTPLN